MKSRAWRWPACPPLGSSRRRLSGWGRVRTGKCRRQSQTHWGEAHGGSKGHTHQRCWDQQPAMMWYYICWGFLLLAPLSSIKHYLVLPKPCSPILRMDPGPHLLCHLLEKKTDMVSPKVMQATRQNLQILSVHSEFISICLKTACHPISHLQLKSMARRIGRRGFDKPGRNRGKGRQLGQLDGRQREERRGEEKNWPLSSLAALSLISNTGNS